jgi:predicted RNase H-like HicB family nuclease
MKYLVIIEPTESGFSAYSPDVPGCIATGDTEDETRQNIRDAIAFHLEGMAELGIEAPKSNVKTAYIEIAA